MADRKVKPGSVRASILPMEKNLEMMYESLEVCYRIIR